ncbi:hypothetical protein LCGC14_2518780, partial [marine sediment metagenome]
NHTFRKDFTIESVRVAIENDEAPEAMTGNWNM